MGSDATTPIGVTSITSPGGSSVVFPAVTLQDTTGASALLRGVNHTRPDSVMTAPTGHTVRQAEGTQPGYMTCFKIDTTTGATATVPSINRNTTWTQAQVEIRSVPPAAITQAAYRWYDEGTESGSYALRGPGHGGHRRHQQR